MHFKNYADMMMMVVLVFAILRLLIFKFFIKGQGNPEVSDVFLHLEHCHNNNA